MQFLDNTFLGNPVRDWLIAFAVTVIVFFGLRVVVSLVIRRSRALAGRTSTDIDDIVADVLRRTKVGFLLVIGLVAGTRFLSIPAESTAEHALRWLIVLAIVVQVGLWGELLVMALVRRKARAMLEEDAASATLFTAFGFVLRLALWAVLLLMGLQNLGIQVGPLLAGLGVGGLAVALALQNVLSDLLASLSIALDKPFVIGDFIVVGDMLGTVEYIGLKTTRLRSLSGEQLVFSNTDLLGSRIRNFKRMQERRILFTVGVTYQTPYEKLQAIPGMIREIIESHEGTRFDRSHFKAYGDSSLDIETVYFVLSAEYNTYMNTQQAINLEIYQRFEANGIEFAYPTRTLFVERGDGEPGKLLEAGAR